MAPGDNKFSPSSSTTRGMLMTVLARYAGQDTTNSIPWYQAGMDWAKANGVYDGTNPTINITREQLVTMAVSLRWLSGRKRFVGQLHGRKHRQQLCCQRDAVGAVENGIVNGSNGKLNPEE